METSTHGLATRPTTHLARLAAGAAAACLALSGCTADWEHQRTHSDTAPAVTSNAPTADAGAAGRRRASRPSSRNRTRTAT